MKTSIKITIIFTVIGGLFLGLWASLDSNTKCRLIYGKNICNFYKVTDTVSTDPENSDFEKAMQLCREMEDVPKKDSCFEFIAQVVSFYDVEKAKEACSEIKGFDNVNNKGSCYRMIEKPIEERLAESAVIAFMEARIQRDQELALYWLTEKAEGQYLLRSDLPLTGLSNPHLADFEMLEREKLDNNQFTFKVRIYEEYTSQGRVGYFDETLTVVKDKGQYLIDSFERSQYTQLDGSFKIIQRVPEGTESGLVQEDKIVQDPLNRVSITFNHNIDKNTLTKDNFYALQGIDERVPGRIECKEESQTASLIFDQEIKGGKPG
ncbi:MAG: hypothetical protein GF370_02855 [Candidatus Nealsonbacteria bacterium]|nr:hypothetical protein [Candidatus Nealsonbacteria bacterium]